MQKSKIHLLAPGNVSYEDCMAKLAGIQSRLQKGELGSASELEQAIRDSRRLFGQCREILDGIERDMHDMEAQQAGGAGSSKR